MLKPDRFYVWAGVYPLTLFGLIAAFALVLVHQPVVADTSSYNEQAIRPSSGIPLFKETTRDSVSANLDERLKQIENRLANLDSDDASPSNNSGQVPSYIMTLATLIVIGLSLVWTMMGGALYTSLRHSLEAKAHEVDTNIAEVRKELESHKEIWNGIKSESARIKMEIPARIEEEYKALIGMHHDRLRKSSEILAEIFEDPLMKKRFEVLRSKALYEMNPDDLKEGVKSLLLIGCLGGIQDIAFLDEIMGNKNILPEILRAAQEAKDMISDRTRRQAVERLVSEFPPLKGFFGAE